MARITVDDCTGVVPSRFDLVVLAAQRARQVLGGAPATIDRAQHKMPLIALREIAAQTVPAGGLEEAIVQSFRKYSPQEDLREDLDAPEEEEYDPHRVFTGGPVDLTGMGEEAQEIVEDADLAKLKEFAPEE